MKPGLGGLLLVPMLLGGCALPLEYNIASYLIDGLSYVFSGKSATDYALSAVAESDCALFRAVDGNDICYDADAHGADAAGPDAPVATTVATAPEESTVAAGAAALAAARPLPKPERPLAAARPLPKPDGLAAPGHPSRLALTVPLLKPAGRGDAEQVAALGR
ncbi:MAG: hypothetical protein FJX53_02965 [Alphaproteobacteria bacterium]|nr:hypothetical protein [Alphaproteobacteria bacterium]